MLLTIALLNLNAIIWYSKRFDEKRAIASCMQIPAFRAAFAQYCKEQA
jgi:hypothetical protein